MKRQAIIITSPWEESDGKNHLKGAKKDAELWDDYLTSLGGGEWYSNEIKIFKNPSKKELVEFITNCEADFCFISFSGHGFVDNSDNLTYCFLNNKKEIISETELRASHLLKQVICIDACREKTQAHAVFEEVLIKSLKTFSEIYRSRDTTRKIFDEFIEANANGKVLIYSANVDQQAGEDENGGYYTRSIITACNKFANDSSNQSDILDIVDAFISSKTALIKYASPKEQDPQIKYGRRLLYFPFAINLFDKAI